MAWSCSLSSLRTTSRASPALRVSKKEAIRSAVRPSWRSSAWLRMYFSDWVRIRLKWKVRMHEALRDCASPPWAGPTTTMSGRRRCGPVILTTSTQRA